VTDTLTLALRVGFSLAIVFGLMWVAARVFRNKLGSRGAGTLEVLARQQVGRGASVAVLRVADRALVVGVTEHHITLLGDPITDLAAFTAREPEVASSPVTGAQSMFTAQRTENGSVPVAPGAGPVGPLSGSVLSPATWRQALQVLRERTVRRG
jgi:flagellar protein FliO/FliZ